MRSSKVPSTAPVEDDEDKQLDYQRYTNYVDPSAMTIEHYRAKGIFDGTARYALRIEQWLAEHPQPELNKPLVFHSEPGAGKKSMLVQWLEQHTAQSATKRQRSLVLLHFGSIGGNNTNYFQAIYRLLIRLREALKIKQKVELLEEKIRKFFAYWLDVCSNELEKQLVVNETTEIYSTQEPIVDRIIIVIEGIENFLDADTGKESNIAFWLPKSFPRNIKVIVTTNSQSEALDYFTKIGCQTIQVEHSQEVHEQLLRKAISMPCMLQPSVKAVMLDTLNQLLQKPSCRKNLYLFTEIYLSALVVADTRSSPEVSRFISQCLKDKFKRDALPQLESLEELYDLLIGFWDEQLQNKGRIKDLLLALCISQKGLTAQELQNLCGIDAFEWRWLSTVFRVVLVEYRGLWMIHDATFRATCYRKFAVKDETISALHERTADALQQTANSIRKLEEQTYHLYASSNYFKLKENISSIENFLLLFNPNNKYDLSRYWQKLEEKGFDPVIEYNKAIEGFTMHYHPTEENIFRIIVQISRFLKEFCDFETYLTPNFRHPPIEGNIVEMDKIGLLKELEKLKIYVDNSCAGAEEKSVSHPSLADQIKELKKKYFSDKKEPEEEGRTAEHHHSPSRSTGGPMFRELLPQRKTSTHNILSDIEQLNVDVPKNREKFRAYYVELLKDYMQTKEIVMADNPKAVYLETDENCEDSDEEASHHASKPHRKDKEVKLTKIKQTYSTADVRPSLYYYKRWIWIQFPWACISLQNDYSKTPELCLTSATEYMSVEAEAEFTRQALKIAIEAKERKKLMFTKKCDESTLTIKRQQTGRRFAPSTTQQTRQTVPSMLKPLDNCPMKDSAGFTKVKTMSMTITLSSLTKELEAKKCKNNQIKQLQEQVGPENCIEDMQFIDRRKTFKVNGFFESMTRNEQLPKLKNEIKAHTDYELNYIKSHIEEKKKVINQIIYENNKLTALYRQLKIKESQAVGNEDLMGNRRLRPLMDLRDKKERTITEFCKSLLQKERLKIILKLCSENKTKNQEYLTSLNYLLQNLKKMIKWESSDMKRRQEELNEIQQLNSRTAQAEKERDQNEELLKAEIKQSLDHKQQLERQISNMSQVISQEVSTCKNKLENNISGDRLKNQQKTVLIGAMQKQLQLERNTQLIEEELQVMQNNYQRVAQLLDIKDFDYADSAKFRQLMEQKERNRELNIIYFERKNKLEQLQARLAKCNDSLDLCYENQSVDEVEEETNDTASRERTAQLSRQLKILKDNSLKFKICYENLAMQLKLKDTTKKDLTVLEINNRLQRLREHSEQLYQQFMDGRLPAQFSCQPLQ